MLDEPAFDRLFQRKPAMIATDADTFWLHPRISSRDLTSCHFPHSTPPASHYGEGRNVRQRMWESELQMCALPDCVASDPRGPARPLPRDWYGAGAETWVVASVHFEVRPPCHP